MLPENAQQQVDEKANEMLSLAEGTCVLALTKALRIIQMRGIYSIRAENLHMLGERMVLASQHVFEFSELLNEWKEITCENL